MAVRKDRVTTHTNRPVNQAFLCVIPYRALIWKVANLVTYLFPHEHGNQLSTMIDKLVQSQFFLADSLEQFLGF